MPDKIAKRRLPGEQVRRVPKPLDSRTWSAPTLMLPECGAWAARSVLKSRGRRRRFGQGNTWDLTVSVLGAHRGVVDRGSPSRPRAFDRSEAPSYITQVHVPPCACHRARVSPLSRGVQGATLVQRLPRMRAGGRAGQPHGRARSRPAPGPPPRAALNDVARALALR